MRILVIDDNETTLFLISYILTKEGYEVQTLLHAEKALENIQNYSPHLLLLDVNIGGHDGRVISREVRENSTNPNIKIVLISGELKEALNYEQYGADGFITKPFELDDFVKVIKKQLPQASQN